VISQVPVTGETLNSKGEDMIMHYLIRAITSLTGR
jgi:hypothetical protein